jgi:transcriptional regulator with XRE-family HTH domain
MAFPKDRRHMVGERLAELREQKALTLRELEEASGIGADAISKIENGHRKPRPSTLRKLARALGVEVEDFFREPAVPLAEASREAGQHDQGKLKEWFEELLRAAQPLAEQSDETIALARETAERQARGEPPIAAGFVEDEPPERAALEAEFLRFIQEQRERIVEAAREGK